MMICPVLNEYRIASDLALANWTLLSRVKFNEFYESHNIVGGILAVPRFIHNRSPNKKCNKIIIISHLAAISGIHQRIRNIGTLNAYRDFIHEIGKLAGVKCSDNETKAVNLNCDALIVRVVEVFHNKSNCSC